MLQNRGGDVSLSPEDQRIFLEMTDPEGHWRRKARDPMEGFRLEGLALARRTALMQAFRHNRVLVALGLVLTIPAVPGAVYFAEAARDTLSSESLVERQHQARIAAVREVLGSTTLMAQLGVCRPELQVTIWRLSREPSLRGTLPPAQDYEAALPRSTGSCTPADPTALHWATYRGVDSAASGETVSPGVDVNGMCSTQHTSLLSTALLSEQTAVRDAATELQTVYRLAGC